MKKKFRNVSMLLTLVLLMSVFVTQVAAGLENATSAQIKVSQAAPSADVSAADFLYEIDNLQSEYEIATQIIPAPTLDGLTRLSNMTDELRAYMTNMQENDTVKVYVWRTDVDFFAIDQEVFHATGFSEDALMMVEFFENTIEERAMLSEAIDTYISTRREIAREHYYVQNSMFVSRYLRGPDVYFQRQFSPMIVVELTRSEIADLSRISEVELIALYINHYDVSDLTLIHK